MPIFRFCGLHLAIGGARERQYTKFGEVMDLTDQQASELILGRTTLVADEDFANTFTDEELRRYSNPASHARATGAFLAKKKRMLLICHDTRLRLQSGGPLRIAVAGPESADSAPAQ